MIKSNYKNIIILIIASVVVFWPVLHLQFQMYWDDQWMVMNDYTEDGFDKENLWFVLTEFYHGQYGPVTELYFIILYAIAGYNALLFHLAGLLVHVANVILVYYILYRLMTSNGQLQQAAIPRIAFLTALLFAVHPLQVESVAWISAVKVTLYSLFYLLALHCYLSYVITSKIRYYLLALLLFTISFGAKDQAVMLPVCLLLFDYILQRKFNRPATWLEKIPFFALAIFFGIVTMLSQAANSAGMLSDHVSYPFYQNIAFASYSVTEYITKCIVPIKLSYLYPFPIEVGQSLPVRFWLYPFLLFFTGIIFWKFFKPRWLFFGIGFFLVHIVLVSNILPLSRSAIVADRYAYLASIGIFFLIAYCLECYLRPTKYWKPGIVAGLLYLSVLCVYTHERCKVWHDSNTLKQEMRGLLIKQTDAKKTSQ